MEQVERHGLFSTKTRTSVPLHSIAVNAVVRGFASETTGTFLYKNSSPDHIEVAFTFPVDDNTAVYRFEAELDGRTIVSELQEKKQATESYNDALSSGHTATLLEESDSAGDIFHCKVGNLRPDGEAKLIISMVTELKLTTDGAVSFTLPTVLCPRYNPGGEVGGMPQAAKQPTKSISTVPHSFHFDAIVESNDSIINVKSSKDSIHCDYLNDLKNKAKISLTSTFVSDHDLSFDVYFSKPYDAKIYIEKGSSEKDGILKKDVAMVNFFPELTDESYSSAQELIFVIDRSGSMSGSRIKSAKETLLLLLKSLPVGCFFNIISFGSRHAALFSDGSRPYGQDTLAEACQLQKNMEANFGGTEIMAPLLDIYSKAPMSSHARQILLLTDGEVSNTDEVIKLVEKHSDTTRVFSFGIGEGVSTSLINGVARAGRGKAEFVTTKDRLQSKVMKTMKAAMQDSVTNLSLVCLPDLKLIQIPQTIPPIFSGDKLVIYAVLSESEAVDQLTVTLRGKIGEKQFESSSSAGKGSVINDSSYVIHRLAAKAQIKELEATENDGNEANIVLLSRSANIISKYTSMVGVDKDKKENIGTLIHHDVVIEEDPLMYACSSSTLDYDMFGMSLESAGYQSKPKVRKGSGLLSAIAAPARALYKRTNKKRKKSASDSSERAMASSSLMDDDMEQDYMCLAAVAGPPPIGFLSLMDDSMSGQEKQSSQDYMDLISLQSFCGSWLLDEKLATVVKRDLKMMGKASPISNKEVWGTILAIVFLEEMYPNEKDEWEMVVKKAEQWLGSQQKALEGKELSSLRATAKALALKL